MMLIMATITAITVYYVAKIYKFAILNNGSKISWGKALSGATRAS